MCSQGHQFQGAIDNYEHFMYMNCESKVEALSEKKISLVSFPVIDTQLSLHLKTLDLNTRLRSSCMYF